MADTENGKVELKRGGEESRVERKETRRGKSEERGKLQSNLWTTQGQRPWSGCESSLTLRNWSAHLTTVRATMAHTFG